MWIEHIHMASSCTFGPAQLFATRKGWGARQAEAIWRHSPTVQSTQAFFAKLARFPVDVLRRPSNSLVGTDQQAVGGAEA